MERFRDWSTRRQIATPLLFVPLGLLLLGVSIRMELEGISTWWLVVDLGALVAIVSLRPDAGWRAFRLTMLRDVLLWLFAAFLLIALFATDFRSGIRIQGEARRLVAAYHADPERAQSLLAEAREETLSEAGRKLPPFVVDREWARREAERRDRFALEQRRIAERRREEAEFAQTPAGRFLGMVVLVGWLLTELVS